MTAPRRVGEIASFHAHIYFDPDSGRESALTLRSEVAERFAVRLGTVWDRAVGPHAQASFQIAFGPNLFATLVPWLMLNHRGLDILIHPNTSNPKRDHLIDAMWIGTLLAVSGEDLPEQDEAELAGPPNTTPTLEP
jgi:DOPA 4,5-dioxygenase